jgi:hypothetical protein
MTSGEAKALISMLALAFPAARFSADNAQIYERAIADLESGETQNAVEGLIKTAARMPTIAELRAEVMTGRRELVRLAGIPSGTVTVRSTGREDGPSASEWGAVLSKLLERSARFRAMAEPWYRERGRHCPPDPMAPYIELARRGARGEDVLKVAAKVLGVPRC